MAAPINGPNTGTLHYTRPYLPGAKHVVFTDEEWALQQACNLAWRGNLLLAYALGYAATATGFDVRIVSRQRLQYVQVLTTRSVEEVKYHIGPHWYDFVLTDRELLALLPRLPEESWVDGGPPKPVYDKRTTMYGCYIRSRSGTVERVAGYNKARVARRVITVAMLGNV